jgi:hypothetical protein
MEPPSLQDSSLLSTAPSDSPAFLETLQAAHDVVAVYVSESRRNDYTAILLRAILDSRTYIGLSGFYNVL